LETTVRNHERTMIKKKEIKLYVVLVPVVAVLVLQDLEVVVVDHRAFCTNDILLKCLCFHVINMIFRSGDW